LRLKQCVLHAHRQHRQFAHDRRRDLRWLFEAKKRFELCVLNYMARLSEVRP
jgi:hypothetical protein